MAVAERVIFQFGSYNFPNQYIKWESIKIKPNQRQDLDSYTDADGLTHRNALSHTKSDVQFETRQLNETEYNSIMGSIKSNYINFKERDAMCTYYNPENCTVSSGHFYLDPSLEVDIIGMNSKGQFIYKSIKFHFVEY